MISTTTTTTTTDTLECHTQNYQLYLLECVRQLQSTRHHLRLSQGHKFEELLSPGETSIKFTRHKPRIYDDLDPKTIHSRTELRQVSVSQDRTCTAVINFVVCVPWCRSSALSDMALADTRSARLGGGTGRCDMHDKLTGFE